MGLVVPQEKMRVAARVTESADSAVIIVCAGSGERLGTKEGKALTPLLDLPLFAWAVLAADVAVSTAQLIVVCRQSDKPSIERTLSGLDLVCPVSVVCGGATRQESVAAGLQAIDPRVSLVAIQDGARPLTPSSVFELVAAHVRMDPLLAGAIAAKRSTNTLKVTNTSGLITATPDRDAYWCAETPQTFRRRAILAAYKEAQQDGFCGTDDASVVERWGGSVACVEVEAPNMKVTVSSDLIAVRAMLAQKMLEEQSWDFT